MKSTHEIIAETCTCILQSHDSASHTPSAASSQSAGLTRVRARKQNHQRTIIVRRRANLISFRNSNHVRRPSALHSPKYPRPVHSQVDFLWYVIRFLVFIVPYFTPGGKGGVGQTWSTLECPVSCSQAHQGKQLHPAL